jgi:hypothetical protein
VKPSILITAATLLLTGCPNELFDQISEDVLVESAGGRPVITEQIPAPGATEVLSDSSVKVVFNMPLASDATGHLRVSADGTDPQQVEGKVKYNTDTNALVFQPAAPLDVETRYTVTVSEELKNAGGASLGDQASWGFDTTRVNPDQFRFDIDMSDMDVDLSTYRTYLSVQPESSVSDSFLGGTIFGGDFGDHHSFVFSAHEAGVSTSEGALVSLIVTKTEIVPIDPSDPDSEGFPNTIVDMSADLLVWIAYDGSAGTLFPSWAQTESVQIAYGAGGFPRGVSVVDAGNLQEFENTLLADIFLERGIVHTLVPEDAYFTLDYQDIQATASEAPVDEVKRVEVDNRYAFTALTFESQAAGSYAFRYNSDTVDNRDTYSQLMLFKRSGSEYTPVTIDSDPAVTTESVPVFTPSYDDGDQFGYLTWQVDADGDNNDDQNFELAENTEYLLVVDSWLHVPGSRSGQIDSGAFRILVDSSP